MFVLSPKNRKNVFLKIICSLFFSPAPNGEMENREEWNKVCVDWSTGKAGAKKSCSVTLKQMVWISHSLASAATFTEQYIHNSPAHSYRLGTRTHTPVCTFCSYIYRYTEYIYIYRAARREKEQSRLLASEWWHTASVELRTHFYSLFFFLN